MGGKGAAFYVDTATTQSISGTKTFQTLQVGDSLFLSFFDTVYRESLNERDFATSTKWITTGNFSISGGKATFSGTSGTLRQKENKLALTGLGDSKYRFIYTVSNMTGVGCVAFINTDFALSNTNLVLINATDTLNFTSNSDPTDFKIECTCTSGGFDLDDFSLKVKSDSIVFVKNDLYTGGIFAEGSSAFGGDVQILGNLKGGSPLTISTPIGDIEIDGDIHFIKDAENWTIGIDTSDANQFKISNDAILGTNDRLVIDVTGSVGIGTTTPNDILHIANSSDAVLSLQRTANVLGDFTGLQFKVSTDISNGFYQSGIFWERTNEGFSGGGKLHFAMDASSAGNVSIADAKLTILQGGNVGIGINNPTEKLEVNGSVKIKSAFPVLSVEGAHPTLTLDRTAATQFSLIKWSENGTGDWDLGTFNDGTRNWRAVSSVAGLSLFLEHATGNVGIGTDTPDRELDVSGTAQVITTTLTDNGMKIIGDNLTTGSLMLASSNSSSTSSRNLVNIINDNASASGAVPLRIQQDAVADIFQAFDGTERVFTIDETGNVGIQNGTGNDPQYRLDIGLNSYFAINGSFGHIIQHNSAASTFWSVAPRNGGNLDFAVTTTDPRPSGGTIATSGNAISIKTNKDVEFLGNVGIGMANPIANTTAGVIQIGIANATTVPTGTVTGGGILYSTGGVLHWLKSDNTDVDLLAGGGDVSKTGTPVNNQIAVWTNSTTVEGTSGLTYNGSTLTASGAITATGNITASGTMTASSTGNTAFSTPGGITVGSSSSSPISRFTSNGNPALIAGVIAASTATGFAPLRCEIPSNFSIGQKFITFHSTVNHGYIQDVSAGGLVLTSVSDKRMKENIKSLKGGLDAIKAARPVSFNWKRFPNRELSIGFIAQELYNAVPKAVDVGNDEVDKDG